ncbi:MAG: ATP-binding cassette domain-containing protein, partial [Alphaproteobacteria bacterium]
MRSVTRSAGRETVFQQANLTFTSEKPTVLLGLSLAGRKAALRIISGADRPEAGAIFVNGVDRQRGKDVARFAWIGREGIASSGRSVGKVLRAAAASKSGDGDLARLAGRVGLAGKLDVRTRDLDPESRVRLAIGCAMAARHPLMLLDAPFQDLPAEARASLLADLPGMLADAGAVIVLAA